MLTALLASGAPLPLVIRDARVVRVSGRALERATVVMQGGRITAVGENVAIPAGAWVVDGKDLTVYPGLIDALSTWGLPETVVAPARRQPAASSSAQQQQPQPPPAKGPEDRPLTFTHVKAADLIRTDDATFAAARSAGFTNAVLFPTRGIVGGQGAVVHLAGATAGQMVLQAPAGIHVALTTSSNGFPNSLLGSIAYVRQLFLDAYHAQSAAAAYKKDPSRAPRPAYDRALDGLLEVPRVLLPANTQTEAERMLRLVAELKLKAAFYGGHGVSKAAPELKQAGIPVLVNLRWPERDPEADPDEPDTLRALRFREQAPRAALELARAGVRFAFYSGGVSRPSEALANLRRAVASGLSEEAAVRALTLGAAEIYGLEAQLGSIDVGKLANLTVVRGSLFADKPDIRFVVIEGKMYEPVPADSGPQTGPPRSGR